MAQQRTNNGTFGGKVLNGAKPKPAPASVPEVLADMRAVYKQSKRKDKCGQKLMRTFMEDDPKGFVKQMCDMERAYLARLGVQEPEKPDAVVDVGAAECIALAERLLEELT